MLTVIKIGREPLLFAVSTKFRVANIKLSELLQIFLILASGENKIIFKAFLLMLSLMLVTHSLVDTAKSNDFPPILLIATFK